MYTSAVFADRSDSEVCKLLVAVLSDVIELLIDVIDVLRVPMLVVCPDTVVSAVPMRDSRLFPE